MNLSSNALFTNHTYYNDKLINAVIPEGVSKVQGIKVGDIFKLFYSGSVYRFRAVHICSKIPGNHHFISKDSCSVDLNGSKID